MRQARTLDEVNQVLKQIQDKLDLLQTQNLDLHQRRIVNASNSVDSTDYITQQEVIKLLKTAVNYDFPDILKKLTVSILNVLAGQLNITNTPVILVGSDFTTDKKVAITNGPFNITAANINLTNSPITDNTVPVIAGPQVIPLAALSGVGTQGSITVQNGFIVGFVLPT